MLSRKEKASAKRPIPAVRCAPAASRKLTVHLLAMMPAKGWIADWHFLDQPPGERRVGDWRKGAGPIAAGSKTMIRGKHKAIFRGGSKPIDLYVRLAPSRYQRFKPLRPPSKG